MSISWVEISISEMSLGLEQRLSLYPSLLFCLLIGRRLGNTCWDLLGLQRSFLLTYLLVVRLFGETNKEFLSVLSFGKSGLKLICEHCKSGFSSGALGTLEITNSPGSKYPG